MQQLAEQGILVAEQRILRRRMRFSVGTHIADQSRCRRKAGYGYNKIDRIQESK
jgi:hypothetical protein